MRLSVLAIFAVGCGTSASNAIDAGPGNDANAAQDSGTAIIGPSGVTQALHDVSILWPLPTAGELGLLLDPSSPGAHGELLPASLFDKFPQLAPNGATRDKFRVVGTRIDPCFKFGTSQECKPQLRLVLQPLSGEGSEPTSTLDTAIHLFYSISAEQLASLAAAFAGHGSEPTRALGVHPTLSKEGLNGTFATRLRALILAHAGASNLVRATFMLRTASKAGDWEFGGFDVTSGNATPMVIATLGVTKQRFTASVFGISGNATPALTAQDNPSLFFQEADIKNASQAQLQAAYDGVLRTLSPTAHTADSIDCVSCHTATSSKYFAENLRGMSAANNANAYRATLEATPSETTKRLDVLRSFGYFGNQPVVSARVANESDDVVSYLRREVFKTP